MEITFDYETVGLEHNSPDFQLLFCGWLWEEGDIDQQKGKFDLEMYGPTLIAHNAKYDLKCLLKDGFSLACPTLSVYDTQIAFKILREDLPREAYKLESLAGLFYEYPNYKQLVDFKDKKENYYDSPEKLEQLKLYNRHDLYATRRLRELTEPALRKHGMWNLFLMTMDFVKELSYAEMKGIKVDVPELDKQEVILKEKADAIGEYLKTVADINWDAPAQVGEYFAEQGLKLKKSKKTGKYLCDKEVLKKLALESKIAETILEWRKISKQLGTYTEGFRKLLYNGIYYPDYDLLGTVTLRLSERFIQIMPRPTVSPFKKIIVSKFPGGFLLGVDWSQLEICLNAEECGDPQLIQDILYGIKGKDGVIRDIHNNTLYTFPFLPDRTRAKNANFTPFYGGVGYTLVKKYGFTEEQAADFIEYFFKRYPKVRESHIKKQWEIATKGYVTAITGYRRHTDSNYEAYNAPIQHMGTTLNKIMFTKCSQRLRKDWFKTHPVGDIHDEVLFDGPPEEKDEAIKVIAEEYSKIKEYFYSYFGYELKLDYKCEMKIGKNLYDTVKI